MLATDAGAAAGGAEVSAPGACAGGACEADASSYSTDFTCVIGTVCVTLSSPANVISVGEVAVTMPASVEPSRISTVACCPDAVWLEQDARNRSAATIALTKTPRHPKVSVAV